MKRNFILLTLLLLIPISYSIELIPQGNIRGMNTYDIYDFVYINATYLKGDGTEITNIGGVNTSFNQTLTDSLYIAQSSEGNLNVNSSSFWDLLNTPLDITALGTIGSATSITSSAFVGPLTGTASVATTWDGETSQSNLNVNSSSFWDNLNTPTDITSLGTIGSATSITSSAFVGPLTGTASVATTWDGETSQSNLNVNHSTTSTTAATATSWDGETSQANLNVNHSSTCTTAATATSWDSETSQSNLNVNHSDTSALAEDSTAWITMTSLQSKWFADTANVLTFDEPELNTSIEAYGYSTTTGTVTNVATDDTYLTGGAITSTGTITYNTTLAGTSLAVNSSDYWDNLGSPSDIGSDDITDDGTWIVVGDEGNLNVNHSTTSTTAATATTWDSETSQANLNVNSSNYWDTIDTPLGFSAITATGIITAGEFAGDQNWTDNQNYPTACPAGTFVSTNADSNTCTAPTAADVDPGTFPAGNYIFSDNITTDYYFGNGINLNVNHSTTSGTATTWDGETSQGDLNVNNSDTTTTWDGETSQSNLNVNHSTTSTTAATATSWNGETSQSDLNVNSSNYWDTIDTPSDFSAITASGRITADDFAGDINWTYNENYPTACSSGTWVTTNGDSNTCTAPTAADVDAGTYPAGNYIYQGSVTVDQNGNAKGLYIDSEATSDSNYGLHIEMAGGARGARIDMASNDVGLYLANSVASTSEPLIRVYSAQDNTGTGNSGLVNFQQDSASATGDILTIKNDGTGTGILINQDGVEQTGVALDIDSEANNTKSLRIESQVTGNNQVVYIRNNAIQAGASAGVMYLVQEHASSSAEVVNIKNDGTGQGIVIDQNGNADALYIDNAGSGADIDFGNSIDIATNTTCMILTGATSELRIC